MDIKTRKKSQRMGWEWVLWIGRREVAVAPYPYARRSDARRGGRRFRDLMYASPEIKVEGEE